MLRRVAVVRTDVSEERIASIIRVTRIGEIGTTLAVTSTKYFFAASFGCYLPLRYSQIADSCIPERITVGSDDKEREERNFFAQK
jgi:hypothetical protein